jgi:hypothetical protein
MDGANYKALDLLYERKGIWKEAMGGMRSFTEETCNAYIERMDYLMNEEIKSERLEGYIMYRNLIFGLW